MNEIHDDNERIERILSQVHVPAPPDELKNRVIGAAHEAWERPPADISWQVPVRRLALSAAAAILIVSLANHLSRFGVHENARRPQAMAPTESLMPDASLSPLMKHQLQTGRRSSRIHAPALHRYLKNVQMILQEVQDSGTDDVPVPQGGGSHLPPSHRDFATCV